MSMDRRLIDYLPPVIRETLEYQAIMDAGEQLEIEKLWAAVDNALDDQYLQTATRYGIARWEAILKIKPKGTDTLEDRRFRILTMLFENTVYTYNSLVNQLNALCGPEGYSVQIDPGAYTIWISLKEKGKRESIEALLKRMLPANILLKLMTVISMTVDTVIFSGAAAIGRQQNINLPSVSHQSLGG